jgi:hypothetical protein
LLSALILWIRFRQRILPFIKKLQDLPRKNKLDGLLELERELLEVETEAQEFGLRMPNSEDDDPPLVREFRGGGLFLRQYPGLRFRHSLTRWLFCGPLK